MLFSVGVPLPPVMLPVVPSGNDGSFLDNTNLPFKSGRTFVPRTENSSGYFVVLYVVPLHSSHPLGIVDLDQSRIEPTGPVVGQSSSGSVVASHPS